MPSLGCFDTAYLMDGEVFAEYISAKLFFFADFCIVPVTVPLSERVHWPTTRIPSWSSFKGRSALLIYTSFS